MHNVTLAITWNRALSLINLDSIHLLNHYSISHIRLITREKTPKSTEHRGRRQCNRKQDPTLEKHHNPSLFWSAYTPAKKTKKCNQSNQTLVENAHHDSIRVKTQKGTTLFHRPGRDQHIRPTRSVETVNSKMLFAIAADVYPKAIHRQQALRRGSHDEPGNEISFAARLAEELVS